MKDKASSTHVTLMDRIRSWWILRNKKIKSGAGITFKKNVDVSICQTGLLEIGERSFFNERVWLLLTMPHPKVKLGKWVFLGRNTILACKNSVEIGNF